MLARQLREITLSSCKRSDFFLILLIFTSAYVFRWQRNTLVFSSHTKMLLQHCSTWKRFALASCQRTAHHFVKVEHLEYLLKARENLLYTELRKKMASAMVYTKVGKKMPGILKPIGDKLQEKGIFNTWMLQEQDLIQAFAKAYADRIVCEAFRETIAGQFGSVDPSLSGVLASVFHLHLLNSVEKDLSTFLASDLLNSSQAEQVSAVEHLNNLANT